MKDEKAAKYTSGIGIHQYMDGTVSPVMMDLYHDKYPDKLILYTESSINKAYGQFIYSIMIKLMFKFNLINLNLINLIYIIEVNNK